MKRRQLHLIHTLIIFWALPVLAEIDPSGKDAPPEIVAKARQLFEKRDYAGIDALVAQIDARYGKNRGSDYFRSLLGVESAFPKLVDPAKIEFAELWAERKLLWKILLTPYSQTEDAGEVQDVKDFKSVFGVPIPFYNFERDKDQFIALRDDAAALLTAYGESLRTRVILGYQRKPERGLSSGFIPDPKLAAAAVAEEKRLTPQLERNEIENDEQDALSESLRLLGGAVDSFVRYDFSWPPEDDETVNALIKAFPPITETRERLLADLAELRKGHVAELKKQQARANPIQANAPKP